MTPGHPVGRALGIFFAVAGTAWAGPHWVFFAGSAAVPITELRTISEELRPRRAARESRAWDEPAVATLDDFLRELARRAYELLPRKKRRALKELRFVVERYRTEAMVTDDEERLELARQVLGLPQPAEC